MSDVLFDRHPRTRARSCGGRFAERQCTGHRIAGMTPAHIAQSVEHFLGKEEVTGSNPVMGSIRKPDAVSQ